MLGIDIVSMQPILHWTFITVPAVVFCGMELPWQKTNNQTKLTAEYSFISDTVGYEREFEKVQMYMNKVEQISYFGFNVVPI